MESRNRIEWLQQWYETHCDGSWEHEYGIRISTLDNPGWAVKIDLVGTHLEKLADFDEHLDQGESDWLFYGIKNKEFWGSGDARKLDDILAKFQQLCHKA